MVRDASGVDCPADIDVREVFRQSLSLPSAALTVTARSLKFDM